jgi:hypothetical protein
MPTVASLAVIIAILTGAIVFSIRKTKREEREEAAAAAEAAGEAYLVEHDPEGADR